MNRKIIMLPLSLAAVFSLVACGGNQDSSNTSSSSETTTSSASSSSTQAVTISVSKSSVTLEVGGTEAITATVSGSTNTNKVWSSSDESVATVTAGLITAVKAGTCTITVAAEADSTVKATISVTVTEVAKITLGSLTAPVSTSQTYYGVITAKTSKGFMIDDGTGALYVYKSLNSSYAIGDYVSVTDTVISYYGFLETTSSAKYSKVTDGSTAPTPKAATALTIAKMNEIQAQCTDGASSGGTTAFHASDIGPFTFTATADCSSGYTNFYLAEDTNKANPISPMAYSGDNFIDGAEYTLKGYFAGKHSKGYWQFVVAEATANFKNVESVSLDKTTASITALGDKITLKSSVLPKGANTAVTWSSSDAAVATVDDGVVTSVAAGTATITATSVADTTKSASCVITITNEGTISYNSVAKYNFSEVPSGSSSTINAQTVLGLFNNASYLSTGTNVVTNVTTANNIYQAQDSQGPRVKGLKLGSGDSSGKIVLSVSSKIAKVTITGYAWNSSKLATLTVNDETYAYVAADAGSAKETTFTFAESDSLSISSSIYSVITGIELFTKTVA